MATKTPPKSDELKNTGYELFIAALSILSIVNLVLYYLLPNPVVKNVVGTMDWVLSGIFLVDFLYRFFSTSSKSRYFFRQFGWADLLASLPFPQAKILRLFRILRAGRMMREYGASRMIREFFGNRGSSTLLTLLFFMILILEFGGITMLSAESRSPEANIENASDVLWYIYVTVTTVGYGDRFPVTNEGRLIGVLILTTGVGLFGALTAFLAQIFLEPAKEDVVEAKETGLAVDDPRIKLAEIKRLVDEIEKLLDASQPNTGK